MGLTFNEFNSFYEEIRQIVKEEVQEELALLEGKCPSNIQCVPDKTPDPDFPKAETIKIKMDEGFFDAAKGIFGGGGSHAYQGGQKPQQQTSQAKLGQAQQDAKIAAEFRTFKNKNPNMNMTLDQYKKVRDKIKQKEWDEAKQQMSNIQSIADREAGKSARSKFADERKGDLAFNR